MNPKNILTALLGLGLLSACDAVENAIDCDQVCQAYADCFDSDYDVGECTDMCEDNASESDDFDRLLEQCEACIEDQSCVEATAQCGAQCSPVIVVQ